jgi:Flp pilus assembly protein TadD
VSEQSADLLRRGVTAAERGQVRDGLAMIRQALVHEPRCAEAHAQLGRWLSLLHRGPEALAAIEQAIALDPHDALTLDTIGVVLSRAAQHERAVGCFARAVRADPSRASLHFNLASSLKFLGRLDEAERAYEDCLAREPLEWRAHGALSQLRTQTAADNHLDRLAALLASSDLPVDAELQLRHALAKELEDVGRHAESFQQLQAGKQRKRAAIHYSFERDRVLFAAVTRLFGEPVPPVEPAAAAAARQAGQGRSGPGPAASPIFVVGMPRTGTTLVERILSSHTQVSSAGESQNFGVLVKRATGTSSSRVLDTDTLERSTAIDLPALGTEYVARTRPDAERARFVDKLPLNFFYVGHIVRALPDASIVVVRRAPLDTCLSNFRQLFALGYSYYDYAYDLLDTGRYFVLFDRLIAHWRRVFPGRVHEISYEALVADQRTETARLLQHCRLPWQDGCLTFERNAAAVATASAVQVRRSLHGDFVGRWRRYERELEPLVALLESAGIDALQPRAPP